MCGTRSGCTNTAKELGPIVAACAIWGPRWQSQHVLVYCDNIAGVHVITAQSSKDMTLMHLLRCIRFFSAVHNFQIRAEHIPGQQNVIVDSISRNNLQEALSAQHKPTPIQCGNSSPASDRIGSRPSGEPG